MFNKVIYQIFEGREGFLYLEFLGWVYLWGAILHFIAALTNGKFSLYKLSYHSRGGIEIRHEVLMRYIRILRCSGVRAIRYSGSHQAIRPVVRTLRLPWHIVCLRFDSTHSRLAIITLILPHYFNAVARSGYATKAIRRFCSDYGMPITIIAATGLAYWGRFNPYVNEEDMTLPVTRKTWATATGRSWLVPFWELEAKYVGIAFPFGLVLFILFYFDANVSVGPDLKIMQLKVVTHRARI